jgi:hypothetical protein
MTFFVLAKMNIFRENLLNIVIFAKIVQIKVIFAKISYSFCFRENDFNYFIQQIVARWLTAFVKLSEK